MKILVAYPDPKKIQLIVEGILNHKGHEILSVNRKEQLEKKWSEFKPEVILVSPLLLRSIESFYTFIRTMKGKIDVYVLIVSDDVRYKTHDLGLISDGFIPEPIQPEELETIIYSSSSSLQF